MSAYLPALIWSLSSIACMLIAKRRQVPSSAARAMLVTLAGPFAIPFVACATAQPAVRTYPGRR